jgi:hypothetical protein
MIKSFKAGVPVNGQPFPEGSMIVKLQWKLKKSTEAPFVVEVPDDGRKCRPKKLAETNWCRAKLGICDVNFLCPRSHEQTK